MISSSDVRSAYRAIPIFLLATSVVVGISALLARTVFGSPIVEMSDGTALCVSVAQYSGITAPQVELKLTVNVKLTAPLGGDEKDVSYVKFGVMYYSDLEPKETLKLPDMEMSGNLLQVTGTEGGLVSYDSQVQVQLSGSVQSSIGYLLAYDASDGDFKALLTADVYFSCDSGTDTGCRRVVWRSTKTINSVGVSSSC
eukprot:TRINITY_DN3397_c0_g1_i1.p1 TRINITY_DN3397_c0_g1~~TRINITY_DN3397_c0_g1_i1.p1  ORF type:complete len:198 (-),score=38.31 TRINITY_DN3397_c0_g1_i1:197-790(-)